MLGTGRSGTPVLDLGCGSGFHLERWVDYGATAVIGCEPHTPLADRARDRVTTLDPGKQHRISVIEAGAEDLPLKDRSVDVMHARWAYFFGSGCEPGLAELDRVMAPGGVAFVIETTSPSQTSGAGSPPPIPPTTPRRQSGSGPGSAGIAVADHVGAGRGRTSRQSWIEFPGPAAERILAEHDGLVVDYPSLRTKRY